MTARGQVLSPPTHRPGRYSQVCPTGHQVNQIGVPCAHHIPVQFLAGCQRARPPCTGCGMQSQVWHCPGCLQQWPWEMAGVLTRVWPSAQGTERQEPPSETYQASPQGKATPRMRLGKLHFHQCRPRHRTAAKPRGLRPEARQAHCKNHTTAWCWRDGE